MVTYKLNKNVPSTNLLRKFNLICHKISFFFPLKSDINVTITCIYMLFRQHAFLDNKSKNQLMHCLLVNLLILTTTHINMTAESISNHCTHK